MSQIPGYYKPEQAGKKVGRSKRTITRWIREGLVRSYAVGKTALIPEEELPTMKKLARELKPGPKPKDA